MKKTEQLSPAQETMHNHEMRMNTKAIQVTELLKGMTVSDAHDVLTRLQQTLNYTMAATSISRKNISDCVRRLRRGVV